MRLTVNTCRLIQRIINVFETGTPDGDYAAISIYPDGPHDVRQITYGRSQTTEYGNLRVLIERYAAGPGIYSKELAPYVDDIGVSPLTDNRSFRELLRKAGFDRVMRTMQDELFDERYFLPAMRWMDEHGMVLPLSALVVYDSFIHSGGILASIRATFPDSPPASGGNERRWIANYVNARHHFLATHHRPEVRKTVYRTHCFMREIERSNWSLIKSPIVANGVPVRY
jgi:chitosanase